MNCNVIRDLIPLYIDDCCSEESTKAVREHLENCSACKEFYESMKAPADMPAVTNAPLKLRKLNEWKASVMQSVMLFVSFAIITIGVAFEAQTPYGLSNGYWAFSLVIPATGFLLSLANWYFVRLYKSRKSFSNGSLIATLSITVCAYIWACFHYELDFLGFLQNGARGFILLLNTIFSFAGTGFVLTAVFCILSKALSYRYAMMLGKE